MTPVNNKSLLHFVFDQMQKLDKNEIDVETAKTQANLAGRAISIQRYELEKARTEIHVREFNLKSGANLEIRNVEGKGFE